MRGDDQQKLKMITEIRDRVRAALAAGLQNGIPDIASNFKPILDREDAYWREVVGLDFDWDSMNDRDRLDALIAKEYGLPIREVDELPVATYCAYAEVATGYWQPGPLPEPSDYEMVSRKAVIEGAPINRGVLSILIRDNKVQGEPGRGGRVNLQSFAEYRWRDPEERDHGIGQIMAAERRIRAT